MAPQGFIKLISLLLSQKGFHKMQVRTKATKLAGKFCTTSKLQVLTSKNQFLHQVSQCNTTGRNQHYQSEEGFACECRWSQMALDIKAEEKLHAKLVDTNAEKM